MITARQILESIRPLIINERLVSNLNEIDDFIKEMLKKSPNSEVDTWLKANLRNYLINDFEASKIKLDYLGEPGYLPSKLYHYDALDVGIEKGEPVYWVSIDYQLRKDIDLIIDLHASGQGPKTGNWKYMSVPDAIKKGQAWKDYIVKVQNGQAGIEIYKTYSNGYRWVEVLDEVALAYEAGQIKGTCLIDAKRWMSEFERGRRIFSLRDSRNRSRAQIIFEDQNLDEVMWMIGTTQISAPGSSHRAVDSKDYEYCYDFLNQIKPKKIGELSNIGGAVFNGKVVNKESVPDYLPDFNELFDYLHRGNIDKFESYLSQGIDINLRDNEGNTFLIKACHIRDSGANNSLVKYLINKGIDVNARNKWGDTALHISVEYSGNPENTRLLLAAGAHPRIKCIHHGDISLHRACLYEDIKMLLDAGCNADARNKEGENPLLRMIRFNRHRLDPRAVELLLKSGADPNVKDNYFKETALDILSNDADEYSEAIALLKKYM